VSKSLLKRLIAGGFGLLVLGFAYILVLSLTERRAFEGGQKQAFDDIAVGQTAKRLLAGRRVWVTRFSDEERARLDSSHPCASSPVCVVSALGQADGIDIVYTRATPPQIRSDTNWQGGFVDPTSGAVYDLSGRALLPKDSPALEILQP
jgi:hypothetical protein